MERKDERKAAYEKKFWVSIACIYQEKTEKSGEHDSVYSIKSLEK